MKRAGSTLLILLVILATRAAADPYQQYYGRGYCTDYVNSFLIKKIRGDAGTWRPNVVAIQSVQKGDVVIFRQENHVARVEEVQYQGGRPVAVKVSEQNYGKGWINQPCRVTTNFGKTTTRIVQLSRIDGIYRESASGLTGRIQEVPTNNAKSTPPTLIKKPKTK